MFSKTLMIITISAIAVISGSAQAPKPSVVTGDVASVSETKIAVNSPNGKIDLVLSATTAFKRVPPENPNIAAAVAATLSEIAVGDKVMATGILSEDGKTLPARSVYLMTKADLSEKAAKENEMWRTRGISGKVTSVNVQTNQIVFDTGGFMAKTSMTLTPKADAKMLRYAPNSLKFSDAKPSSISDIKAGDEIRALGDKSSDGTAFSADTVLTGGFRQAAGRIKSIDLEKKEVVLEDLNTKKDFTVAYANAVMMKRFPEEMVTRMIGMQMAGAPGGQGGVQVVRPVGGGQPSAGGQPAGGAQPGAGPRPMGGGRPSPGEMIDRLPNMPAEDLKVGEVIAVLTSSATAGSDRVSAFKLVAGVEPFIKLAQMGAAAGAAGRGGRGVDFNIPGLDSSFP